MGGSGQVSSYLSGALLNFGEVGGGVGVGEWPPAGRAMISQSAHVVSGRCKVEAAIGCQSSGEYHMVWRVSTKTVGGYLWVREQHGRF